MQPWCNLRTYSAQPRVQPLRKTSRDPLQPAIVWVSHSNCNGPSALALTRPGIIDSHTKCQLFALYMQRLVPLQPAARLDFPQNSAIWTAPGDINGWDLDEKRVIFSTRHMRGAQIEGLGHQKRGL